MNNIEPILERIAQDTKDAISALEAQTDREIEALEARYEAQAQEVYDRTLAQGQAQAQAKLEQLESTDALETRKQILAKKQELVGRAFDQALLELRQMDDARKASLLSQLAASASETGREEVLMSVDNRERIGPGVVEAANLLLRQMGRTGELTLSEETRSREGGLYLRDGKIETNCSYATLVRLIREKEAAQVAELLFS